MKIISIILIATLLFILINCFTCRATSKILKVENTKNNLLPPRYRNKKLTKGKKKVTKQVKNDNTKDIINAEGTVLAQFGLGLADILVSDPSALKECQPTAWKIDQPTVEKGTQRWYVELTEPLVKMKGLMDTYALDPVCKRQRPQLQGWIHASLDKEKLRHDKFVKQKKPYVNIHFTNPYPSSGKKHKGHNKKLLMETQTGTKDWMAVLKLSLPLLPYHMLRYKMILDKIMFGFVYIQMNEYIDCD